MLLTSAVRHGELVTSWEIKLTWETLGGRSELTTKNLPRHFPAMNNLICQKAGCFMRYVSAWKCSQYSGHLENQRA